MVRPRTRSSTAPHTPITDGPDVLPALPGDLDGYEQVLPTQDQQVLPTQDPLLGQLRGWPARQVAPIAIDQRARTEFPHHLIPRSGTSA